MKILVLVAVVAAVWYGFKMINRITEDRNKAVGDRNSKKSSTRSSGSPTTEDMIACPECGTFVSASSTAKCERANCPY